MRKSASKHGTYNGSRLAKTTRRGCSQRTRHCAVSDVDADVINTFAAVGPQPSRCLLQGRQCRADAAHWQMQRLTSSLVERWARSVAAAELALRPSLARDSTGFADRQKASEAECEFEGSPA